MGAHDVVLMAVVAAAVVAAVLVLDRVLLWMERRGWIFYRHRRAAPGTLGSALVELESLMQPARQHVVDVRRARPEQASPDANVETAKGGTPGRLPPVDRGVDSTP